MRTPSDSDEAMLRDPNHPSHTSGGRDLIWAVQAVAIAGIILYYAAYLSWVPFIPYFVGVGLIGVALGFAFLGFVSGTNERHRVRIEAEYRAMIEADKQTRIEEIRRATARARDVESTSQERRLG